MVALITGHIYKNIGYQMLHSAVDMYCRYMYLPGGVGAQTVHNHPEITLTEPSVRVAPKKAQKS